MLLNLPPLKRLTPILFLLALLYSQLGYYVAGAITQWLIKEAAKEKILHNAPDASLVAIPLKGNETAIEWEEEGEEFSLNGQLFDVVRTKIINGSKVYYCFDDKDEDRLLQKLNANTKTSHQQPSKMNSRPGVSLLYTAFVKERFYYPAFIFPSLSGIYYHVSLPQRVQVILVPPPRM